MQAIEREGALDKLRTKQFAADKLFLQQVSGRGSSSSSSSGRLTSSRDQDHQQSSLLACAATAAEPL